MKSEASAAPHNGKLAEEGSDSAPDAASFAGDDDSPTATETDANAPDGATDDDDEKGKLASASARKRPRHDSWNGAPAPPPLRSHEENYVQPGAFRVASMGSSALFSAPSLETFESSSVPEPVATPVSSDDAPSDDARPSTDDRTMENDVIENASVRRSERRVIRAEPMSDRHALQQLWKSRKFRVASILLLLCIAAASAVVLTVGIGGGADPSVDDEHPTETFGDLDLVAFFRDYLPEYTRSSISSDPESPQASAFRWLLNNNAHLDSYSQGRRVRRFALATVYFALDGDGWSRSTRWLSDEHECEWFFFRSDRDASRWVDDDDDETVCTESPSDPTKNDGILRHLWMSSVGSSGDLPPELGLLTSLETIFMTGNDLTSIPSQIGYLTNLREILLSDNRLRGQLNSEIFTLPKLQILDLSQNFLTQSIPDSIGRATSLKGLILNSNSLTGSIPTSIRRATGLEIFDASLNVLTGSIPPQVGDLSDLRTLGIFSNGLVGELPATMGRMSALVEAIVGANALTGPVPSEMGLLTNLELFDCFECLITGTLPTELGMATNLRFLHLFGNPFLSGRLPSELGRLSELERLWIFAGLYTGQLPTEVGLLTALTSLAVVQTTLTGTLPTEIGALSLMESMSIETGRFTGSLPSQIENLTRLTALYLFHNEITGTMPSAICELANLGQIAKANLPVDCDGIECDCCFCDVSEDDINGLRLRFVADVYLGRVA